jgi:hypothetical protein
MDHDIKAKFRKKKRKYKKIQDLIENRAELQLPSQDHPFQVSVDVAKCTSRRIPFYLR